MDVNGVVVIILAFVDGLFFGLAIKKGVISFVLLFVAFFLAAYMGFSFIPKISFSGIISKIISSLVAHISIITNALAIGTAGSFSLLIVLFFIGLAIGLWKG